MVRPISTVVVCALCSIGAAGLPGSGHYIEAYKAEQAGMLRDALEHYRACAGLGGPLEPYAKARVARCLERAEQSEAAEREYRTLLVSDAEGPWVRMVQAELAALLADQDRHAEAAALYRRAVDTPAEPWWFSEYAKAAAENGVAARPNDLESYAYFRDVVRQTFYYSARREAARALAKSPSVEDQLLAVVGLARSGNTDEAGKLLLETAPRAVLSGEGGALVGLLRRVLFNGGGLDETPPEINAESLWQPMAAAYGVLRMANAGKLEQAQTLCDALVAATPDTRESGDALWWLAEAYERKGQRTDAIRTHLKLVETCTNHRKFDDSLLEAGLLLFRLGRYEDALELLRFLGEEYSQMPRAGAAWFWIGKIQESRDETSDAIEAYRQGCEAPWRLGEYHAHRAAQRLFALTDGKQGVSSVPHVSSMDPIVRPLPVEVNPPDEIPERLRQDPHYLRLAFFGSHGLEEGEWEAMGIALDPPDRAWRRHRFAILAETGFAHSAGQFADAEKWGYRRGAATLDRLRLDYPKIHWATVSEIAGELRLDPFILLAVARQESTFRPNLTSHAGAHGMMQVMPSTATWLAEVDSRVEPEAAGDLGRPFHSLRLGAVYLRRMIDRSGGNLAFALAAYNGGPGNLDKWLRGKSLESLDEFIEAITFAETKDYVERVLGNYMAYHTLYPEAGN